jgi:hypothetical protein
MSKELYPTTLELTMETSEERIRILDNEEQRDDIIYRRRSDERVGISMEILEIFSGGHGPFWSLSGLVLRLEAATQ